MIRILLAVLACALPIAGLAQYPNKPIRMIIPLAAASAVDNAARIVTQKMAANMGPASEACEAKYLECRGPKVYNTFAPRIPMGAPQRRTNSNCTMPR